MASAHVGFDHHVETKREEDEDANEGENLQDGLDEVDIGQRRCWDVQHLHSVLFHQVLVIVDLPKDRRRNEEEP